MLLKNRILVMLVPMNGPPFPAPRDRPDPTPDAVIGQERRAIFF